MYICGRCLRGCPSTTRASTFPSALTHIYIHALTYGWPCTVFGPQACAAGWGLRRDALVRGSEGAEGAERGVAEPTEALAMGEELRGAFGTIPLYGSHHHNLNHLNYQQLQPRPRLSHADADAAVTTTSTGRSNGRIDPWVGPHARGGLVERPILVEVPLGPLNNAAPATTTFTSNSSASASASPAGCVCVRGLEVLPASIGPCSSRVPSQRPFVFLHGFLGGSSDWLPVMRALAVAGHRCVALDLPGHGGTTPPLPQNAVQQRQQPGEPAAVHSIPGAAACVERTAVQLGLWGAVLVGYSLGARVALQVGVEREGVAQVA